MASFGARADSLTSHKHIGPPVLELAFNQRCRRVSGVRYRVELRLPKPALNGAVTNRQFLDERHELLAGNLGTDD